MALDSSTNYSSPLDTLDSPLFHVCWRRQSCSYCLAGDVACSWCAISSTCVPNAARLPILAPLGSTQLCPLGAAERWELRALPFGCPVSTLTVLSVLGALLGSAALIAVGCTLVWLVQGVRRRWKQTEYGRMDDHGQLPPRNRIWNWEFGRSLARHLGPTRAQGSDEGRESETRPLLED